MRNNDMLPILVPLAILDFDYDAATYVVAAPRRYVEGLYGDPYFYGWPGWWGFGFGPRVFVEPRFHSGFHSGFRSGFHGGGHR